MHISGELYCKVIFTGDANGVWHSRSQWHCLREGHPLWSLFGLLLFDGAPSVCWTASAGLTAAKDAEIGCISEEGTTKEASENWERHAQALTLLPASVAQVLLHCQANTLLPLDTSFPSISELNLGYFPFNLFIITAHELADAAAPCLSFLLPTDQHQLSQ